MRSDGRFEFEACEGVRYRAYAFAGRYSVSRYSAEVEFTAARDLDELVLVIDKSQEEHLESSRKLGVR